MKEQFPRNTISFCFYCARCRTITAHRIDRGNKGPCLRCIERLENQHTKSKPVAPATQRGFDFGHN